MTKFGDAKYKEMVNVLGADGITRQCLSKCEHFKIHVSQTQADFPAENLFPHRPELCYVMKKVVKACKDPWKKIKLESRYQFDCEYLINLHENE